MQPKASDRLTFQIGMLAEIAAVGMYGLHLMRPDTYQKESNWIFWTVAVAAIGLLLMLSAMVRNAVDNDVRSGPLSLAVRLIVTVLLSLFGLGWLVLDLVANGHFSIIALFVSLSIIGDPLGAIEQIIRSAERSVVLDDSTPPPPVPPDPFNDLMERTAPRQDPDALNSRDLLLVDHDGGWRLAIVREQRADVLHLVTSSTCWSTPPEHVDPTEVAELISPVKHRDAFIRTGELDQLRPMKLGTVPWPGH